MDKQTYQHPESRPRPSSTEHSSYCTVQNTCIFVVYYITVQWWSRSKWLTYITTHKTTNKTLLILVKIKLIVLSFQNIALENKIWKLASRNTHHFIPSKQHPHHNTINHNLFTLAEGDPFPMPPLQHPQRASSLCLDRAPFQWGSPGEQPGCHRGHSHLVSCAGF